MKRIEQLVKFWNNSGRTAHYYPRKHKVSLNGFKVLKETEAISYMSEVLKADFVKNGQALSK